MEKTSKEKEETTEKMIHKGEIIISPYFFVFPVFWVWVIIYHFREIKKIYIKVSASSNELGTKEKL